MGEINIISVTIRISYENLNVISRESGTYLDWPDAYYFYCVTYISLVNLFNFVFVNWC